MSAASAVSSALALPPHRRPSASRPGYLRLVAARRSTAARTPFLLVVLVLLAAGLVGLLALNTVLAQDAFRLHALQAQTRALADREQALQREVAELQSPQSLAARATRLGMVAGGPPGFLVLPEGKVLGKPEPGAAPAPVMAPRPAAVPVRKAKPTAGAWQPVPRAQASTSPARPTRAPATTAGASR